MFFLFQDLIIKDSGIIIIIIIRLTKPQRDTIDGKEMSLGSKGLKRERIPE